MKNTKVKYKFIRFGGLSSMEQKDRYNTDNFHAPPKKKGIYAFPYPKVVKFLLGATNHPSNISNKSYWLKDDNGNKITSKEFYEENQYDKKNDRPFIKPKYVNLLKRRKIQIKDVFEVIGNENDEGDYVNWYMCVYKKPRIFEYDGEIWCHLIDNIKPENVIEYKGTWVKVSMIDYIKALNIELHNTRKEMIKLFGINYKDLDPFKFFVKDHLEVFIEKIN
ncbi:MAG: hypothetical protein ACOC3V_04360 [bacterium]